MACRKYASLLDMMWVGDHVMCVGDYVMCVGGGDHVMYVLVM